MKNIHIIIFLFIITLPHVNGQNNLKFNYSFEDCEPIISSLISSIGQDLPSGVLINEQGYYYVGGTYKILLNTSAIDLDAGYYYKKCDRNKIMESAFYVYINELSSFYTTLIINQWDEQLRNMGAKMINAYREDSGDTIEYELNGYNIHLRIVPQIARISFSVIKD
ncbi:MAG: hypothetical protein FWD47_09935 [Treponema sp.]|nr:hypothetical protein [Treponema sp.]